MFLYVFEKGERSTAESPEARCYDCRVVAWKPTSTRKRPESRLKGLNLLLHQGRSEKDMGGCQNYGPFLGPYYNTALNM